MDNNHFMNNLCISFLHKDGEPLRRWLMFPSSGTKWVFWGCAPWELLQTKRKHNRKRGHMKTEWARRWSYIRVWETLEEIMMYTCSQLGCWQDGKKLSRAFREAVWSLLQHRKLPRHWFRSSLMEELTCKKEVEREVPLKPLWLCQHNRIVKIPP